MSLMNLRQPLTLLTIVITVMMLPVSGITADQDNMKEEPPEFTEAFLNDSENQEAGKKIWQEQCRHCHGNSAYPGKAPKLKPRRYKPSFVYSRVTNGFRKMPSWKEVYNREERMSVVTYVLSDSFSP